MRPALRDFVDMGFEGRHIGLFEIPWDTEKLSGGVCFAMTEKWFVVQLRRDLENLIVAYFVMDAAGE